MVGWMYDCCKGRLGIVLCRELFVDWLGGKDSRWYCTFMAWGDMVVVVVVIVQICNCQFTFSLTERPALWNKIGWPNKTEHDSTRNNDVAACLPRYLGRYLSISFLGTYLWTIRSDSQQCIPSSSLCPTYDYLVCRHLARQVFNPLL